MSQIFLFLLVCFVISSAESAEVKCSGGSNSCLVGISMEGMQKATSPQEKLEVLCRTYRTVTECMQKWNRDCRPTEENLNLKNRTKNSEHFMELLCVDGDYQREYLNNTDCIDTVAEDWKRCKSDFPDAAITVDQQELSDTQSFVNMCCLKYNMNQCISVAARSKCSTSGAVFQEKMVKTLTHDNRCDNFNSTLCQPAHADSPEDH